MSAGTPAKTELDCTISWCCWMSNSSGDWIFCGDHGRLWRQEQHLDKHLDIFAFIEAQNKDGAKGEVHP